MSQSSNESLVKMIKKNQTHEKNLNIRIEEGL